jgi:hypothetical protein
MSSSISINASLQRLALLGMLVLAAGCAFRPDSAPWQNEQSTIQPHIPTPQGSLVVETQEAGSPRNGEQPYERFYVYHPSGKYMTYFPNDYFLPIGLPVGKYVVVSRYSGRNKRVQVEIQQGLTTYVQLEDFKRAPAIE